MFKEVNGRDWLRWTLVFVVLGLSIAYLNRNYASERGILLNHHIPLAAHFLADGVRDVTTYPLWGYALLIAAVGSGWGLGILQVVASSATLALFALVLRGTFPNHRRLLAVVLLAALPWHFLHSVHWPNSPAAVLVLCGCLALLYSAETKRLAWALLGGTLLGVSLNFRPDGLLLPVAIAAIWGIGRLRGPGTASVEPGTTNRAHLDPRALLVFASAGWLLVLPWAIHYHGETGRYSATSSNGGMVAFISLGQLPGNPWGVVHQDAYATEVLQASGVQTPAWSETGNTALMERFRSNIAQHPGAYARKVLWNWRTMLMAGFYVGDTELKGEEQIQLDVLRERIKLTLGVNPNQRDIEKYQKMGVWENQNPSPGALAVLGWQLVGAGLGALFLLVALAGMVSHPKRILAEPLLQICAALVLYQIAMVGALQYQPRHMNGVFLFLIPFFILAIERGSALVGRVRRDATS